MTHQIINWHEAAQARRDFGDKAADALRNGMGSWLFVGSFILVMGLWATVNTVAPWAWDK